MLRPLLTAILVQAVGLSAGADNLVVNGGFDELDGDGGYKDFRLCCSIKETVK